MKRNRNSFVRVGRVAASRACGAVFEELESRTLLSAAVGFVPSADTTGAGAVTINYLGPAAYVAPIAGAVFPTTPAVDFSGSVSPSAGDSTPAASTTAGAVTINYLGPAAYVAPIAGAVFPTTPAVDFVGSDSPSASDSTPAASTTAGPVTINYMGQAPHVAPIAGAVFPTTPAVDLVGSASPSGGDAIPAASTTAGPVTINYMGQAPYVAPIAGAVFPTTPATDFAAPGGQAPETFVAGSGDSNAVSYPATSAYAIAVGGTELNGGTSGTAQAWSDSGGGVSADESAPNYRYALAANATLGTGALIEYSNAYRVTPDVATLANSVSVYDIADGGASTPWITGWHGTSLSAPIFAGVVALADKGRANHTTKATAIDGPLVGLVTLFGLHDAIRSARRRKRVESK